MSLGLSRQQELNLKEENQDRIRILKEGKISPNPIILRLFCCLLETLNASKRGGGGRHEKWLSVVIGGHILRGLFLIHFTLLETPKIHTV